MNERFLPLKNIVKKILGLLPFAVTRNQRYDRETVQVLQRVCRTDSNCVDVGTHRGEILDLMRRQSPRGHHFGFEPLPPLFARLRQRYGTEHSVHIFPYALSDKAGTSAFNWVTSNPAYSGLQKRRYDRAHEEEQNITVETRRLDDVLQSYGLPIHLMKIDVEGGELGVLRGARETLRRFRPVVIFEFGLGGSDVYGSTPELIWEFFGGIGYHISLMRRWLDEQPPFSLEELGDQFHERRNYYFIAYPQ
ncbi:MAG: FkbM family methyltransferase [Chitinophagaceae bacterium]|nr:MAG: FkbM family methyltransferase [Chitinophagaceae bacterium]